MNRRSGAGPSGDDGTLIRDALHRAAAGDPEPDVGRLLDAMPAMIMS